MSDEGVRWDEPGPQDLVADLKAFIEREMNAPLRPSPPLVINEEVWKMCVAMQEAQDAKPNQERIALKKKLARETMVMPSYLLQVYGEAIAKENKMGEYYLFGWNDDLHKKDEPCSVMLAQGDKIFIEYFLRNNTVEEPTVLKGREVELKTVLCIKD